MTPEEYIIENYILWRVNPSNDLKKDSSFASANNISLLSLTTLLSTAKTDWRSRILDLRRNTYKDQMLEIDKAMFSLDNIDVLVPVIPEYQQITNMLTHRNYYKEDTTIDDEYDLDNLNGPNNWYHIVRTRNSNGSA